MCELLYNLTIFIAYLPLAGGALPFAVGQKKGKSCQSYPSSRFPVFSSRVGFETQTMRRTKKTGDRRKENVEGMEPFSKKRTVPFAF
jgi:hypothetical protein